MPDENEWVALREVVPCATAPLVVTGHEDREVLLSTVLPLGWPAMVRPDGRVLLAAQAAPRSGDAGRDLAEALRLALDQSPEASLRPVVPGQGPDPGFRLPDLLDPQPLQGTLHQSFGYWLDGLPPGNDDVAASLERADASVAPTARVAGVPSAYWGRLGERTHLRWVLPEDEEPLLDALARLSVLGALAMGPGSRFLGSFRAHGLLVPVWDLPPDAAADACEQPAATLRERLSEALADPRPLSTVERGARSGLVSRQLTLR